GIRRQERLKSSLQVHPHTKSMSRFKLVARNCQRGNLLVLDRSQHAQYTRRSRGKTGFLGVSMDKQVRPYRAEMAGTHLGRFDVAEEAAEAYDEAAIERYGASAQLNEQREFRVCETCHTAYFTKCKKCR
ncbi:MAG: hypothetical protein ACPGWR_01020, partial [Ardenticatenaceae bacterium]